MLQRSSVFSKSQAKSAMQKSAETVLHGALFSASMLFSSLCLAQSISYQQAEQNALRDSYTTQAHQALQQASQLEAEALKGLGLPRVDFNVRAYAFHNELDVPLGALKNNLEQTLSNGVSSKIDEWQGALGSAAAPLKDGLNQTIHDGVGLIPDSSQVVLEDQVIRPTVSITMPLYTGGLTSSAKEAANLKAQRSQLNSRQQQDLQLLLDALDGSLGFRKLLLGHGAHVSVIPIEHLEHGRQIGSDLLEALKTGHHIFELGILLVQVTKPFLIIDHARLAHQSLYFFITFLQAFELSDHRLFHTDSANKAAARIARHWWSTGETAPMAGRFPEFFLFTADPTAGSDSTGPESVDRRLHWPGATPRSVRGSTCWSTDVLIR